MQLEDKELLYYSGNQGTKRRLQRLLKYQERLYWHIRRMVVDHDANDVMQICLLRCGTGLKILEDSQLYTWLYRITTNESLSILEQSKKDRR